MRFHIPALAAVLSIGMAAPAAAQRSYRADDRRADIREERRELRADREAAEELAELRREFWETQQTYRPHDDRRVARRLMRWTRQQVRQAHHELLDEQRELAATRRVGHRGNRYEIRDERGEYRNAQRDLQAWQNAEHRIRNAVRTRSLDDSDFVYLQSVTRSEIAEERRELREARAMRRAQAQPRTRVRVRPRQVNPRRVQVRPAPPTTSRTYEFSWGL